MNKESTPTIYTIGHSTRTLAEFLELLQSFSIKTLVDIRSLPGSRKFPQFNQENLIVSLQEVDIQYLHAEDLGGRRKVKKDSKNTRWNNPSFRAYADYMETSEFEQGMMKLEKLAQEKPTAFMCSEAVWWRCHRSMVSDYLKLKGWTVLHIMGIGKFQEHRYTEPARIVGDSLLYSEES